MSLQFADLKFRSEIEHFRPKKNLYNKISNLKSDIRNSLSNYNLCILSKHLGFGFLWRFTQLYSHTQLYGD